MAVPVLSVCSSLARREPRFVGFNERAAFVVERAGERLIFDSAILDFVITTDFFQSNGVQKVEVSEN
jgi:hypothetical protein